MKKRFKQLQKTREEILKIREEILKIKDPAAIARHLITVLEEQGYSTKSFDVVPNMRNIDIMMYNGLDSPLVISNSAQNWRIEEELPELEPEPLGPPKNWVPENDEDLPF